MTASTLTFYDAAYPPNPAPHADGFCFYLPGGDELHAWTDAEIDAQTARYRLPVFVRSNPPGPGAEADVAAAVARLKHLRAPHGTLVAWDMETAEDPAYIRAVYADLKAAGFTLIVYGTQSDVTGNQAPDGLYWGADWTGTAHLHNGDAITQWVSFAGYDEDLALSSLPFWDTRPPAPTPPPAGWTFGPPVNLHARPGRTTVDLSWGEPAGAPERPAIYNVFIYQGTVCDLGTIVKGAAGNPRYPVPGTSGETFHGLEEHKEYTAHVVAEGLDGTRVRPGTYASVTFTTS
jgi:hypothetical protein